MGRKTISNRKSLSFHAASLLFTILLLPLTGSSQLRLNQSQKQQNTVIAESSNSIKQNTPDPKSDRKNVSPADAVKNKKEDISKRDPFSKHYKNEDGSYTALIGAGPIHFEKNGYFYDIDHKITASGDTYYPYANTTNLFESYFGATAHKGVKNRTPEGEIKEFLNTKMYWEVNGQAVNTVASSDVAAITQGDKAYYNNLYGNIGAEFIIESGRRKLNYIIPNAQALSNAPANSDYLVFTEEVTLPQDWTHSVSEKGILIKNQTGNNIYLYENPVSTDMNSDTERGQNTIFETALNGNILTIKTKVKTNWLLSNERQFPVKVDPTVNVTPNNTNNWTGEIWSDGFQDSNAFRVGWNPSFGWHAGYVRFNLSSIPTGSTVNAATGYINITAGTGTNITTRTWALTNSADPLTVSGTALYNSITAAHSATTVVCCLGWQSSLFSASGRTYLQNAIANGFVPMSVYAMGTWSGTTNFTMANRTSANRPYLSITYTESVACSGTPTGGTASLNPTSGTFGSTFTASVSGSTTGASGLTYQWESAPSASGPWTNVSGATTETSTITAVSTATTTYYRRRITCSNSGQSDYSSVVSYTTSCIPSYINGNCAGPGDCQYIGISNVTSGTINNTTGFSNTAPAYNNYSSQSTEVSENNTYSLSVRYQDNGFPVNLGKIAAWIDWNGDNDFSGASEFLGVFNSVTNNQVVTFSFSVPAGTSAGTKRLRIRSAFNSETLTSSDACTLKEYGETEDYSVNVIVINFECAEVDNLTAVIGSPANGINHALNVSWDAIAGATGYDIQYSMDNGDNYNNVGTGTVTETSAVFNAGDMPNHPFLFRVRAKNTAETCDWTAMSAPVYTAADNPGELTFGTVTGSSVEVIIPAETPVANPAITTYSLYNETLGLYVQADGSLAVTEVFQTKAAWSTITVFGLTAETEYCFYAKARNEDGDVRFTPAQTLFPTQEFNSNVLTTGTGASTWFAPNSNPPFVYSTGGCNGGRVGYANNTTTTWGNFLRIPAQNLTGMTEVTLGFTLSNSYNAANTTGNSIYLNYWDTAYRSTSVTSIKIDGVPYTATGTTGGKINFDQVRDCANVEITFSLNQANDLSQVFFYFNAAKANVNGYSFYIDDIAMANGNSFSSPDSVCLTTGSGCTAEIISTTNGSGCADILLLAEGTLNTTEFRWYDAEIDGNLLETTATGEWTTPVLTQTTTYYVSSYNGECESDRVAVTATFTPTDAEIIFTEGAAACEPGNVTLWAETSNDGMYTINWYDEETGGNLIHTGYTYTVNLAQSTSFYVAAVDGDCESERIEIAAVINAKTWNGSQSTDWNTPGNWTPTGVPSAAHCVVIPDVTNAPVISGGNEGFAKSLTLLENASLLVESNATITVTENVTLAIDGITGETMADFTLENNGYLVQTQNTSSNNNNGKITVNKNSTPMFRLEATGWASPVEDQKLYDFAVGTVFGRVYHYDETANAFSANGITLESVFEPGQGYSVRAPNTFNPYTESATPTVFEGLFYGKPNNGDISINVTANNLGYNYVGNPYPSPIDAAEFLSSNNNVASLHFWTHEAPPIGGVYTANNYASFTSMGGTMAAAGGEEPDGVIQVGQGFVVKTTQQYLLQFTNDLRIPNSNGQFFRNNTEKHRMWLNLSDNTTDYNQILVGYVEHASMGADHQIDAKMFGYSGNAIYSLIENEKYVIQGRSLPFDNNDIVPIGFKATNAGNFTISISKKDGLFENEQLIYLKDLALNITHNLSESAYSFLTEAGTFENRFEIVYQNEPLSVNQPGTNNNDWIVYKDINSQTLTIESKGFEINEVEIFDLTGRLLLNKKNINAGSFTCQNNFADQVLLVKLNKTLIKKIL